MITKEEVLNALEVIEKYKNQELISIEKIDKEKDTRSITMLNLKTRELNALFRGGVRTIGDLLYVDIRDLRKYTNLGKVGITLINKAIEDNGIKTDKFLT